MQVSFRDSVLLVLLLLTPGCGLTARRLEVSAVRTVQVGVTSLARVEETFGRPNESFTNAQGQAVNRYFFRQYIPSTDASPQSRRDHPGDVLFRTLTLLHGPDRVVTSKLHDESLTPVEQYNGWYVAGPALTAEALPSILRQQTTGRELIQQLGQPVSRSFQSDGLLEWNWCYVKVRPGRVHEPEVRRLRVLLTGGERVADFALLPYDFPVRTGPLGR